MKGLTAHSIASGSWTQGRHVATFELDNISGKTQSVLVQKKLLSLLSGLTVAQHKDNKKTMATESLSAACVGAVGRGTALQDGR